MQTNFIIKSLTVFGIITAVLLSSMPAQAGSKYYVQCISKKTYGKCPANSDTRWSTIADSEDEAVYKGNIKSLNNQANFKACWKASRNRSNINSCDPHTGGSM